ncbi:type IV pilus modification protein PilV [Duganella qianjiadongensis]|uniref:Type IV pilus modification protein PilV n=1 Tax=Duganella qianjiadongensis TaxID=2692176 RepID=A0ABW9VRM1_9BURK|nr:type IV pilus modification protein PilV [Duganella qianjiadongensis]MYM41094.1 type IV pilus modification protein PilV [Duganella qianjiadongensis]
MRARSSLSGFTVLEVLIALLLLALGIVGSAAMQLLALRVSHQDQLLVQANYLASGLAERMRANAAVARDASAANPYLFFYDAAGDAATPAPPVLCLDAGCDGRQLALFDRYEAQWQVFKQFPAGRLRICHDDHPVQAGKLQWDCMGSAAAPLVIKLGWRGKLADGRAESDAAAGVTELVPALAMTVQVP